MGGGGDERGCKKAQIARAFLSVSSLLVSIFLRFSNGHAHKTNGKIKCAHTHTQTHDSENRKQSRFGEWILANKVIAWGLLVTKQTKQTKSKRKERARVCVCIS